MDKILIIDDIEENLVVVNEILTEQGYHTQATTSGREGIAYSNTNDFDLFLIDVRMPELDGFEVCRLIKQKESNANTPVLFFVAKTDYENIPRVFEHGGVDIISKPFQKNELLARVNTHFEIHKQKKKLHELNATKDKFFSIIAHDLRSPFNMLLGFNELLIKNVQAYSPETIKSIAQNMFDASKQTFNLLENLLEWSRLQTGKINSDRTKIKPLELIDEVILLCEPMAKQKGIDLNCHVYCDEYIFADREMIKTVLRNLVTNALKFTYPSGHLHIETRKIKDKVLFVVSDSGIGIEPEHINKLFSIDRKFSNKGTAEENGTGLGLVLCKEFMEIHKEDIWVESELGKGSDFKFTLPLYKNFNAN
ncbi:hybrid sensor histidine kinase/response regulator [Saccharicrinis sp. GN24d3]|uniref:hybrid sensor histidine kinase/response regulator n=1 Tax=Saccharicrinis sp. GN24d3 TaxID=3458416 RepID=UPI004035D333